MSHQWSNSHLSRCFKWDAREGETLKRTQSIASSPMPTLPISAHSCIVYLLPFWKVCWQNNGNDNTMLTDNSLFPGKNWMYTHVCLTGETNDWAGFPKTCTLSCAHTTHKQSLPSCLHCTGLSLYPSLDKGKTSVPLVHSFLSPRSCPRRATGLRTAHRFPALLFWLPQSPAWDLQEQNACSVIFPEKTLLPIS